MNEQLKPASPLVLDRFDQLRSGLSQIDATEWVLAQTGGRPFILDPGDPLNRDITVIDATVIHAMRGALRGVVHDLEDGGYSLQAYGIIFESKKMLVK